VTDIIVENETCGKIEVIYTEKCPNIDEGVFLKEERSLLNNIATELATIIYQQKNQQTD
jgi:GAF domain-containing protein